MHVHKAVFGWFCVAILCTTGILWAEEAATSAPDLGALKAQLKELKQQVDAVRAKRDALRETMRKSPDLAPLREAYDKVEAAYKDTKKADLAYAAAVKARDEARDAFKALVKEKLAANEEAKPLLDAKPDSKEAEKEIRKKLDEIRHAIEKGDDPDVKAARDKYEAASKAEREAYESEALSAARKVRNEARKAYEAKAKELEAASPELTAVITDREDLRKQVRALEKKIAEAPAAQENAGGEGN